MLFRSASTGGRDRRQGHEADRADRDNGLAAGIGAVLGDGTLAAVAAFSMRAISELMVEYRAPIQLVGGAVLVIFGLGLLFAKPAPSLEPGKGSPRWEHTGVIPQTYFLTITNPGAILGTAAIFGGLGSLIGGLENNFEALLLVASRWWQIGRASCRERV